MKQSLISVIVPVYNVKEYLNTCVESILNQTYENLEVILVDDGSTDGSGEVCDSYAKTDARVQVLHTKNGGQAAARNRGIEVCNGEYLTFADSDDSMEPELIETLYFAQEKSGADLVSCRWRNVYEDGSVERSSGQTNGSVTVGRGKPFVGCSIRWIRMSVSGQSCTGGNSSKCFVLKKGKSMRTLLLCFQFWNRQKRLLF